MNLIKTKIEIMIGTQYGPATKELSINNDLNMCWKFCREIMTFFDTELKEFPHQSLTRIHKSKLVVPCIVLFRIGSNWHSGVVWPDGLHFIHIAWENSLQNEIVQKSCYKVRMEKLTRWPWINLLEGFYINV